MQCKEGRIYLLFDGRVKPGLGITDDVTVLTVSNSLEEALRDRGEHYPDSVIYSYKKETIHGETVLVDERFEE